MFGYSGRDKIGLLLMRNHINNNLNDELNGITLADSSKKRFNVTFTPKVFISTNPAVRIWFMSWETVLSKLILPYTVCSRSVFSPEPLQAVNHLVDSHTR